MSKQPESISTKGMVEEVMNAEDAIVIAVSNGQMKILSSSADAQVCVALLTVATSTMTDALADSMFNEPTQLDG